MTAALFDPPLDSPPPRLTLVPAAPGRRALGPEVYRRRRLGVVALVVALVIGLASFGRQASSAHPATPASARVAEAVVVVVQPGDTLWRIATELAPGADPRPLVALLDDLADPAGLQPGQQLVIPVDLID